MSQMGRDTQPLCPIDPSQWLEMWGTMDHKAPKLEEGQGNLSEHSQDHRNSPWDPAQVANLQNHWLISDDCDPPRHVKVICYDAKVTWYTYPLLHREAAKDYVQSLHSSEFQIS